jgi:hypothetical protein
MKSSRLPRDKSAKRRSSQLDESARTPRPTAEPLGSRSGPPRPPSTHDNHIKSWLNILASTQATAFLGVIIGGLIAWFILSDHGAKRARSDQSLAEYRYYLAREQRAIDDAVNLALKCVLSSQKLARLTKTDPDRILLAPLDREQVTRHAAKIVEEYNEAVEEWKTQQFTLELSISYYWHSQPKITAACGDLREAVDGLIACVSRKCAKVLDPDTNCDCAEQNSLLKTKLQAVADVAQAVSRPGPQP